MALGITAKVTNNNYTNSSNSTCTSFTPTANVWLLCSVHSDVSSGSPNAVNPSSTWGTPTIEVSRVGNGGGGLLRRVTLMYVWTGSSPANGGITAGFSGQTQANITFNVYELSGADTSDPIVQSASNADADSTATVTLSTFASTDNRPFGVFGAGATLTAEGGYTDLYNATHGQSGLVAWHPSSADTSVTATLTYAYYQAVAAELKSGAPTTSVSRMLLVGAG